MRIPGILFLLATLPLAMNAQKTDDSLPAFDAESVKLVDGPYGICSPCFGAPKPEMITEPTRIYYQWIALHDLIVKAYIDANYKCVPLVYCPQYHERMVLPDWLMPQGGQTVKFFEISATMKEPTSDDQLQLMLRRMLMERFHLTAHYEKRITPVYALRVAEGGSLLKPAAPPPENAGKQFVHGRPDGMYLVDQSPEKVIPDFPKNIVNRDVVFPGSMKLGAIVSYIQNNGHFDRPVVDMTGLDGYYDINLFIPYDGTPGGMSMASYTVSATSNALKKQLGLELRKEMLPLDVLIVDQADKVATPN